MSAHYSWRLRRSNPFNMDETGLLFQTLPSKTVEFMKNDFKDGKLAKESLTIPFCNLVEKEKSLIIQKAMMLQSFKRTILSSIMWHNSQKAWMTKHIFEDWLVEFNRKRWIQNQNISLFIGNASMSCWAIKVVKVKVCYLPLNTILKLHPLDQGVIKQFKLEYIDDCNSAFQPVKEVTILNAISWIKSSWENEKLKTIIKYFKSCALSTSEKKRKNLLLQKIITMMLKQLTMKWILNFWPGLQGYMILTLIL